MKWAGLDVYIYSFNPGASLSWVANATPRPLNPQERLGTHCTEDGVGHTSCLDGCGKSRPPPGFDAGTVRPAASRCIDWDNIVHFIWQTWIFTEIGFVEQNPSWEATGLSGHNFSTFSDHVFGLGMWNVQYLAVWSLASNIPVFFLARYVTVIKSRRWSWSGNLACMTEQRNAAEVTSRKQRDGKTCVDGRMI
jgi:hypothetical protein